MHAQSKPHADNAYRVNLCRCTELVYQIAFLSRINVCMQATPHQLKTVYTAKLAASI